VPFFAGPLQGQGKAKARPRQGQTMSRLKTRPWEI
jgi:hypothetical protein